MRIGIFAVNRRDHSKRNKVRQRAMAKCCAAILRIEMLEKRTLFNAGTLDSTFGTGGTINFPSIGTGEIGSSAVAAQPDGKIVVVQTSTNFSTVSSVVRRLLANGLPDTTFGANGITTIPTTTGGAGADTILIEPTGKILIAAGGDIVQLNSNGSFDNSFGSGTGIVPIGASGMALQSDGKIIIAANVDEVMRLNANGSVDTTYGTNGSTVLGDSSFQEISTGGVAVDSSGRALVSFGGSSSGDPTDSIPQTIGLFAIERFTPTGHVDTTFGTNGLANDGGQQDLAFNYSPIAIAPDGTIYQGDDYDLFDGDESALSTYTPTGVISHNQNTQHITGNNSDFGMLGFTIDANGNLLVAGFLEPGTGPSTGEVVLLSGPTGGVNLLDESSDGTNPLEIAWSIVVKPSGQIDIAGTTSAGISPAAFSVTQLQGNPTGTISGVIYNDANGNGKLDTNEAPIAGLPVYIDTTNTGAFKTGDPQTTTNSAGVYTFAGLAAGTYIVRQILPSGDKQTFPTNNFGNHVTLTARQVVTNANFGDQHTAPILGSITGTVFNNINGNGKIDSGELGIANVTVYIDTTNAGLFKTGDPQTTTNSSGLYSFTGLAAGTYIVRQILPTGDKQILPTLGFGNHITLAAGQAVTNTNFADQKNAVPLASISGTVFNDANGNGVQNAGELGISGVVLYIDLDNAGVFQTGDPKTTTNSADVYSFSGLAAGTYIVRQVLPAGDKQTSPTNGFGNHVTVASGQAATGANFGDKV
jgi:uncharacterized delta-60 repeat protein